MSPMLARLIVTAVGKHATGPSTGTLTVVHSGTGPGSAEIPSRARTYASGARVGRASISRRAGTRAVISIV